MLQKGKQGISKDNDFPKYKPKRRPRLPGVLGNVAKIATGPMSVSSREIQGNFLPSENSLGAWLETATKSI